MTTSKHPAAQPIRPRAVARPRGRAEMLLGSMPTFVHGGLVRGPGTGTSDSIPAMLSRGEVVMPADTVRKVGAAELLATIDATHEPTGKPRMKGGVPARADGGLLDDPGAVTRVGNSYSGGIVAGPINVNGAAPAGTFSAVDPLKTPAPSPAAAALAAPAPPVGGGLSIIGSDTGPQTAAERFAAPPVGSPPAVPKPAVATPPPAAGPNASNTFYTRPPRPPAAAAPAPLPGNPASRAIAAMSGAPAPAAAPAPAPADAPAPAPYTNRLGPSAPRMQAFADGGLVLDDPNKRPEPVPAPLPVAPTGYPQPTYQPAGVPTRFNPDEARAATQATIATAQPPAAPDQIRASQIPNGDGLAGAVEKRLANGLPPVQPAAPTATQAEVRRVDNGLAAAAAPPAAPPAQAPASSAGSTSVLGGTSAAERMAQMSRDSQHLTDMANIQKQVDANNGQAPGLVAIDAGAGDADRRAQFFEQANLRNALGQTSWSPRRGFQGNDAAVAAAMAPIDARARMAQVTAKEAGDTQRAGIAEKGLDARARMADLRQQQSIGIDQQRLGLEGQRVTQDGKKLALDANRDERAAAAADPKLAAEHREAAVQQKLINGTPEERKAAAAEIAAMKGHGLKGEEESGKALPSGAAQGFITNQANLRTAQNALALLSGQTVDGLKGDTAATGMKGYLPNGLLNRTDPSGVDTRAAIANIGSMLVHDRSGAAVTASETPRLMPFIPAVTDDLATARKKLGQFIANYQAMQEDAATVYKETGYRIPTSALKAGGGNGGPPAGQQGAQGGPAAPLLPPGMARQVGTSGGRPVYEDGQGRRYIAG